jgi:hypothetical protein
MAVAPEDLDAPLDLPSATRLGSVLVMSNRLYKLAHPERSRGMSGSRKPALSNRNKL